MRDLGLEYRERDMRMVEWVLCREGAKKVAVTHVPSLRAIQWGMCECVPRIQLQATQWQDR